MSECNCISQTIYVSIWKKKTKWYEGWVWAPLFLHSESISIHAKDIDELKSKRDEIKTKFEGNYPDKEVYITYE